MLIIFSLYFWFGFFIIISACFVIFSNNIIYSLLWLVLLFLFAFGFLFVLGCEFLAFTFIIIYVGAIAILFLFIIMLLDLKFQNLFRRKNYSIFSVLFLVTFFLLVFIYLVLNFNLRYGFIYLNFNVFNQKMFVILQNIILYFLVSFSKTQFVYLNWLDLVSSIHEIEIFGFIFYDIFIIPFLVIGLILLAVLIGVVYLTNFYKNFEILDQCVFKQISVTSSFFSKN